MDAFLAGLPSFALVDLDVNSDSSSDSDDGLAEIKLKNEADELPPSAAVADAARARPVVPAKARSRGTGQKVRSILSLTCRNHSKMMPTHGGRRTPVNLRR
jgi:hypothetical protein